MKENIFGFPCDIYPRGMWVSVGVTIERLREIFDIDADELDESCNADTCQVMNRNENLAGYLVRFEDIDKMTAHEISHEASHVAMMIFRDIGAEVDLDNQEPFAYLVSWAANKISDVRVKLL